MAVPELVVAGSPYTVYPGGVIALRCTDWMGGARGTLTSESDSRAITGDVVRDTQQVATSIWSDPVGAYQEAVDTLEIDFSTLPIEGAVSDGMSYRMLLSLLIEGDWDTSNDDTYQGSTQYGFLFGCEIGYHGVPGAMTDADADFVQYKPRHRPHFVTVSLGGFDNVVGDEILHVRAYARDGTSIEFLLDQIIFLPMVFSGTKLGQWRSDDFQIVGGAASTFGDIGFDPPDAGGFVDGADGGDTNGKFTWMPFPEEANTVMSGSDGGGDYQKDPDDEYMLRVINEDFYYLVNSVSGSEASAHTYSLHGSNYREAEWWMEDDFSRTVASGWDTSPQGFGWWGTVSPGASVDGSRGLLTIGGLGISAATMGLYTAWGAGPLGAIIRPSDLIFTAEFEYDSIPTSIGASFDADLIIGVQDITTTYADTTIEWHFDPLTGEWWLDGLVSTGNGREQFSDTFDISAFFGAGAAIGIRIERKRYLLRVRVWDASGAEPGTWDYEDFHPVTIGGVLVAYPYGDDLNVSTSFGRKYDVFLNPFATDSSTHTIFWDNIKIGSDPYGDPGDMTASIEKPHGTEVGQIDIPYGAWQMVYWGGRDWTALESGFPAYLDFSAKVWNESGSAEMQRAEALFWWFRSIHGGIIPMNWRSSERPGSVRRVLVGDR